MIIIITIIKIAIMIIITAILIIVIMMMIIMIIIIIIITIKNNNNKNSVTYFDSFGVEHISKEIKELIDSSLSITTNIFRIQAFDSIMCGYFCIGFIDFMLAGNTFFTK